MRLRLTALTKLNLFLLFDTSKDFLCNLNVKVAQENIDRKLKTTLGKNDLAMKKG